MRAPSRSQSWRLALVLLATAALASADCASAGLMVARPLFSAVYAVADRSVECTLPADRVTGWSATVEILSRMGIRVDEVDHSLSSLKHEVARLGTRIEQARDAEPAPTASPRPASAAALDAGGGIVVVPASVAVPSAPVRSPEMLAVERDVLPAPLKAVDPLSPVGVLDTGRRAQ